MEKPPLPSGLTKPTLETYFHVDYDWWEKSNQSFRLAVEAICNELGHEIPEDENLETEVDWIHPQTAQVLRVDRLHYHLLRYCSSHPDFITEQTSVIDGVFRAILGNGNSPLTIPEIAERTGRDAKVILRTLSGRTVYKGIRPIET